MAENVMIWLMLGVFVGAMLGLAYLIDQWADNKYNPEKIYEHETHR